MPFSHVEIEQKKKWIISLFFLILVFLYFLTALILGNISKFFVSIIFSWSHSYLNLKETIVFLIVAFFVSTIHWYISIRNVASKMLKILNAQPIDKSDLYHQRLRNIVEEIRAATGGQKVRCVVIPSISMNAFAIMDFKEEPIIGVTEGLLSKLNRRQLEAVVAHEMAHIVSRDCVITTISCSLFGLYSGVLNNILDKIWKLVSRTLFGSDERYQPNGFWRECKETLMMFFRRILSCFCFAFYFCFIYLIIIRIFLLISNGMAFIIKMVISRAREYQADAIAVRLTRNPLTLAEALYIISRNYCKIKDSEGLSPLFILSTRKSEIPEKEGIWSNLFSTHPPIRKRIKILLDIAHCDFETLINEAKRPELRRDTVVVLTQPTYSKKVWFVNNEEGKWVGPFSLSELSQLKWLRPDSWVHQEEDTKVTFAYEHKILRDMFKKRLKEKNISKFLCPHCKIELTNILYEGVPLYRCSFCEGIRIEKQKIIRLLTRREQGFSDEIVRLAIPYITSQKNSWISKVNQMGVKYFLDCPSCNKKMTRRFYSLAYLIEVDFCNYCDYIWFGKNKLEILQFLDETIHMK